MRPLFIFINSYVKIISIDIMVYESADVYFRSSLFFEIRCISPMRHMVWMLINKPSLPCQYRLRFVTLFVLRHRFNNNVQDSYLFIFAGLSDTYGFSLPCLLVYSAHVPIVVVWLYFLFHMLVSCYGFIFLPSLSRLRFWFITSSVQLYAKSFCYLTVPIP